MRSVCWSLVTVSLAKMAKPTKMPFGIWTRVGPRNHVLDGGPDTIVWMGNFKGGKGQPIVNYRDSLSWAVHKQLNRSRCHLGYGLGVRERKHLLDGIQVPTREGTILRVKRGRPRTFPVVLWLIYSVTQQRAALVWCKCQLGYTRQGAYWRNLVNTMEPSVVCDDDAALYQITLTTCFIFVIGWPLQWVASSFDFYANKGFRQFSV